jgi:hypothetical protein
LSTANNCTTLNAFRASKFRNDRLVDFDFNDDDDFALSSSSSSSLLAKNANENATQISPKTPKTNAPTLNTAVTFPPSPLTTFNTAPIPHANAPLAHVQPTACNATNLLRPLANGCHARHPRPSCNADPSPKFVAHVAHTASIPIVTHARVVVVVGIIVQLSSAAAAFHDETEPFIASSTRVMRD